MESCDELLSCGEDSVNQVDNMPTENNENHPENRDDDQNGCNEQQNHHDQTQKDKKAPIWRHFTEFVAADGKKYAKCKHSPCQAKYIRSAKSNSSTGNMIKHMDRKHPEIVAMDAVEEEEAFIFSQDTFRQALLKWVLMCDQPLNAPQQQAFIDLVKTLNPEAAVISDKTIKADLMAEYIHKINELKDEISKVPGKISITLDGWTSKNAIPFMAIRGHWLDTEWHMQSKLIDFAYVVGDHSGQNHSVILRDCLTRLDIAFTKILAITADNAGSNDTLFMWLDEFGISAVTSQVRCLAHIINLAAQDMMAELKVPSDCDHAYDDFLSNEELLDIDLNEEIDEDEVRLEDDDEIVEMEVIVKLRTLIKKIRKSTKLRQKLNKLSVMCKVKYLVPIVDVQTRWNSSRNMICRAEHLKMPLNHLCKNDKSLSHLRITTRDWQQLTAMNVLLEKFDRATQLISMARHPTISSYLPTLDWLVVSLREYVATHSGCVCDAVAKALTKLEKYELDVDVSIIPFISTILNPALKLSYFKEHEKYSNHTIRHIKNSIKNYFEKEYISNINTPTTSKRKRSDNDEDESHDDLCAFMYKRRKVETNSTELNKYLRLPLLNQKVNVLDYWKSQESEFPFLSQMARDFLPAQSGSVSVERDFSGAVDVVTPTRCSLQHNTIRATMCVKSWLKY